MDPEESQVSVWVCREEKLVSGLTRRTTCADVIRVLLEERQQQQRQRRRGGSRGSVCALGGSVNSYCVVEKWRGFERTLPNKTRLLRLWSAWGAERENVRFVLVRSDASLPGSGPRSAEARVVPSRDGGTGPPGKGMPPAGLSAEKQRRVVRKAFRKLERMKMKEEEEEGGEEAGSAARMETLVHVLLSQDHTARQQVSRIRELDREIERHEARVHEARVRAHGLNYVQDTYMDAGAGEKLREELLRLQEELRAREEEEERLNAEIQEELNRSWMRRRRREEEEEEEEEEEAEEEQEERLQVRTQLDTSLYIGLRLQSDLDEVRGELELSRALRESREAELRELQVQLEGLELRAGAEGAEPEQGGGGGSGGWVEQARGLAKDSNANDEDSDTGLSSMHSQDSDSAAAVCESLV